jgi:hypothetical protein
LQDSNDPLAFVNDLSASELVLVAVKFGIPVPDSLLHLPDPEKLERARELRRRYLEGKEGANSGAIDAQQPPEQAANPVLEPTRAARPAPAAASAP